MAILNTLEFVTENFAEEIFRFVKVVRLGISTVA